MIHNGDFFNNKQNGQFAISYELLCLLRWLIENDTESLKNIVHYAIQNGLQTELQKIDTISDINLATSGIEDNIGDFFKVLEIILVDAIDAETIRKAKAKKLMSAVNKIDASLCDDNTVRISLEKTTDSLERNPKANPKELLYKEILKQWHPQDKKVLN